MRSDGSLRPSLGWTLLALLAAYAPQVTLKPAWITGLLILCTALRWWAEVNRSRLINTWVRTIVGLVCFLAVMQTYGSLNGVGPGSALLGVMAALKVLETKTRRDQFVLLFIALFFVLASFLTEQYLWSAPYLLFSASLTFTAWLAVSRRGRPKAKRWYVRQTMLHMGMCLPVLLAMWVLFPRVPGPFWAIPTSSGGGSTGLSSSISPGDISKLSESQELAFRVEFDGLPPARDQLYWRAIVMQRFNGRTWSADDPTYNPAQDTSVVARGQESRYTVTMEPTRQRWLFALDMPSDWQGRGIYRTRQQTLQRQRTIDERIKYEATSFLDYAADRNLSSRSRLFYTALPPSGNERTLAFVAQLRQRYADNDRLVQAVLDHFTNESFFYTLSPPALGRDSVDEFLFDSRRGFCEHYASSFAFMMRAAGIPARLVAGYQGGETNPLGDYLIVRQSDAHAWTEVWLDGRGWVRVDPTAAVAPGRIEQNLDSALREIGERQPGALELPIIERMQLAWDLVNARWNEWVLGYGPETQRELMERLGIGDVDWRDLTIMLAAFMVGIMASVTTYLWIIHQPPRPDKHLRMLRRAQARVGVPARVGETPTQWANRVTSTYPAVGLSVKRFTHAFLQARYASDTNAATNLPNLLKQIRWQAGDRWRSRRARRRHSNSR